MQPGGHSGYGIFGSLFALPPRYYPSKPREGRDRAAKKADNSHLCMLRLAFSLFCRCLSLISPFHSLNQDLHELHSRRCPSQLNPDSAGRLQATKPNSDRRPLHSQPGSPSALGQLKSSNPPGLSPARIHRVRAHLCLLNRPSTIWSLNEISCPGSFSSSPFSRLHLQTRHHELQHQVFLVLCSSFVFRVFCCGRPLTHTRSPLRLFLDSARDRF